MALKASRKPLKLRRLARGPSKSEVAGLGCDILPNSGKPGFGQCTTRPFSTATRRPTRHQPDLDMSLTMTQGMKRLGMPIAALLGAALVSLIATSWFLNRDALREAVEAQIRAVTGLDLVVKGSIEVSVFPGSYVSFHDVGLKGGGTADPALAVDVLTANLRLLPLLLR